MVDYRRSLNASQVLQQVFDEIAGALRITGETGNIPVRSFAYSQDGRTLTVTNFTDDSKMDVHSTITVSYDSLGRVNEVRTAFPT